MWMRKFKGSPRVTAIMLLVSMGWVGIAVADAARLTGYIDSLESFTARFEQTVYDGDSNPLQQTSGSVTLKRPGKFIWEYSSPTVQTIVSDGKKVWIHDHELEQVTVTALADQASGTPLSLLMGEQPVAEAFDVESLGNSDNVDWFELIPKSSDTDFEQVFVGLREDALAVMELRDSFGQATQILFSDYQASPALDDRLFNFEVPAGVDVIGEG